MSKSIYIVNPRSDFPTYFTNEVYLSNGFNPNTLIADLAIPTLAALAPEGFHTELCDENIFPIDFDSKADFIAITGKITQSLRMISLAKEFRRRGKVVIFGGPYASLSPERLRPYCDILVQGEIENIAGDLFSDLENNSWKQEYIGDKPDLSKSPLPRWDLYPNHRALIGSIQTSRGCPFECEFCDVIQYLGRKQRHKSPPQVLSELDALYQHGYRRVFLADDNFTVYRSRAKELLLALKHWNQSRKDHKVSFVTQLSIEISKDSEMLDLCAEAGLTHVFIGIETPNETSLKETKKRQNLGLDLSRQIQEFIDRGIVVTAGMIVGFDSDDKGIFEQQYNFAMSLPVPVFSLGALVAPAATPLYTRMARENRIFELGSEVAAMPWSTNIVPRQMTRDELLTGVKWLCNRLYHPDAFGERMSRFIDCFGAQSNYLESEARLRARDMRTIEIESVDLVGRELKSDTEEGKMISRLLKQASKKTKSAPWVIPMLAQYLQVRYLYEQGGIWSAHIGSSPDFGIKV